MNTGSEQNANEAINMNTVRTKSILVNEAININTIRTKSILVNVTRQRQEDIK